MPVRSHQRLLWTRHSAQIERWATARLVRPFAHFLWREAEILERAVRNGGDSNSTEASHLDARHRSSRLHALLTQKGLHRWYAAVVKTPIGNTLGNYKISLVGLVHTAWKLPIETLHDSFGPIRAWVNTKGAKRSPKPKTAGVGRNYLCSSAATTRLAWRAAT